MLTVLSDFILPPEEFPIIWFCTNTKARITPKENFIKGE